MPNKFGQAYALTMLSPIIDGHTEGFVHATAIRTALSRLEQGTASPFSRIDTLHVARFCVIDDLRIQSHPAREDHLRSKYLLFVADFDGDLPALLTQLVAKAGDVVNTIWQHCIGFPGTADAKTFAQYVARCQVSTTFPFGAYPKTSLKGVLTALSAQRELIAFLKDHQGAPAAELQQAFNAFTTRLQSMPMPAPGSV